MGCKHPQLGARVATPVVPQGRFRRKCGEVQRIIASGMLVEGRPLGVTLTKGLAATKFGCAKPSRVGLGFGQILGAGSFAAPVAITRPCPECILEADVVVQAFQRLHGVEPEVKPRAGGTLGWQRCWTRLGRGRYQANTNTAFIAMRRLLFDEERF